MHSNDLEACGMKLCCFWFHSDVKFLTRSLYSGERQWPTWASCYIRELHICLWKILTECFFILHKTNNEDNLPVLLWYWLCWKRQTCRHLKPELKSCWWLLLYLFIHHNREYFSHVYHETPDSCTGILRRKKDKLVLASMLYTLIRGHLSRCVPRAPTNFFKHWSGGLIGNKIH